MVQLQHRAFVVAESIRHRNNIIAHKNRSLIVFPCLVFFIFFLYLSLSPPLSTHTCNIEQEDANRGKPNWEHLSDELHVLITVEDTENRAQMKLERAVEEVKKLLVPVSTISLTCHTKLTLYVYRADIFLSCLLNFSNERTKKNETQIYQREKAHTMQE